MGRVSKCSLGTIYQGRNTKGRYNSLDRLYTPLLRKRPGLYDLVIWPGIRAAPLVGGRAESRVGFSPASALFGYVVYVREIACLKRFVEEKSKIMEIEDRDIEIIRKGRTTGSL